MARRWPDGLLFAQERDFSPDTQAQAFYRKHGFRPIPLECPVRLIHGQRDEDVPWQTSVRTAEAVTGDTVQIALIKDGGQRLSRLRDLERMSQIISELL